MKRKITAYLVLYLAAGSLSMMRLEAAETRWAYELSGIYNFSYLAMDDVKDEFNYNLDQTRETLALFGASPLDVKELDYTGMLDLKLGLRYRRILGGISFSNTYSADTGFRTEVHFGNPNNFQNRLTHYEMNVSTKEYLLYVGYLQPVTRFFDLAFVGAVGVGSSEAQIKVTSVLESNMNNSSDKYTHILKDTYTPMRAEAHARINLTRYISLDVNGGYRFSRPEDMRGDIREVQNGVERTPQFDKLAEHHISDTETEELVFDYSGYFLGIGITLKNPLGDK